MDPSDPGVAPVLIVGPPATVRSDEIITNPTQLAPHPTLREYWPSAALPVVRVVSPSPSQGGELARNQVDRFGTPI